MLGEEAERNRLEEHPAYMGPQDRPGAAVGADRSWPLSAPAPMADWKIYAPPPTWCAAATWPRAYARWWSRFGQRQARGRGRGGPGEDACRCGLQWRESGCSMCIGMNGDSLAPGERCASTSNRNFENRQGQGGRTHLMSPAAVAASALQGRLTDPGSTSHESRYRRSPRPRCGHAARRHRHRCHLPGTLPAPGAAHRHGSAPVADWLAEGRPEVAFMAQPSPPQVLVALQNFGCGSSREHAVWALSDYGVQAVVALSFGDIFRNNCVKNGVVAATVTPADHARLLQALAGAVRCAAAPAGGRTQPAASRWQRHSRHARRRPCGATALGRRRGRPDPAS